MPVVINKPDNILLQLYNICKKINCQYAPRSAFFLPL